MITIDRLIDKAWLDLSEKDDRTSPEEYPDMCLISREELSYILASAWDAGRYHTVQASVDEVMGQAYVLGLPGYQRKINEKLRMIARHIRRIPTVSEGFRHE